MTPITTLTTLVLCLTLSACTSGKDSRIPQGSPDQPKVTTEELPNMPLPDALAAKYSRLQVVCQTRMQEQWLQNGSLHGTIENGQPHIVWDLLKNFNAPGELHLQEASGNLSYEVHASLKPSLESFVLHAESLPAKTYHFKHAITLIGARTSSIVWKDAAGNIRTKVDSSESEGSTLMHENIPLAILDNGGNIATSGEGYQIQVKCAIQAEFNPGFENDTQISNN